MVSERHHTTDDEMYLAGKEAGRQWAENDATPPEIEHLQRLFERLEQDPALSWDWFFYEGWPSTHTRAERLAMEVLGADPSDIDVTAESLEFWRRALGERMNSPEVQDSSWLQGFADAGLDAWERVKNRV